RYGSSGAGSPNHLVCALLNTAIGIDAVHVPYRGAALALQDLMGGRIDYLCAVPASLISHIQANLVRALATLAKSRSSALPDLQTADEQGLAGFDATG
ncbi:MAG: tripartite tricarboxylate transporter substrate-binding protein, partial [Xanthobacteraceae bacterium]